jgi:RNA polymerase sigma factor (sigma-70 family)
VSDYLLQVRVKNAPLMRLMRGAGFETVRAFANACKTPEPSISSFLSLKTSARKANGQWREPVLRMAEVLRVMPEDLFPAQHLDQPLKTNKTEITLSLQDMADIGLLQFSDSPEVLMERQQERLAIAQAMADTLSERQQSVLSDRLGLSGNDPMTLEQVAKKIGVTRERIRQIEWLALRRLNRALRKEFPDKYAAYWRESDKRYEVMQAGIERARKFESMEMHESGRPLEVTRIIRDEPTKPPPPTLSSDAIVEQLMQHAVKS